MIPGVNKISGNSKRSERHASVASPTELSPLRKSLGSKTPLDWLKIGINLAKKNYAYIFENTPEKLLWKPL